MVQSPWQSRESVCAPGKGLDLAKVVDAEIVHTCRRDFAKCVFGDLTIKTRDDEAEETTTYYIAPAEKGEWQVIIETHRVLRANPTHGSIVEDKLSIATDIERVEPGTEDSFHAHVISDAENVPESKYRLQFLDYGERIIGTL